MARTKKVLGVAPIPEVHGGIAPTVIMNSNPEPLTHEFSNGELNILRDKINEIIKANR